jgi:Zn finger protein HypA/HybF involved in hydrogenase expression
MGMSVLNTVKEVLRASTQNPNRGSEANGESEGAYWCHDCSERILDLDADGEGQPTCPSCGDEMTFERSAGSTGCAC